MCSRVTSTVHHFLTSAECTQQHECEIGNKNRWELGEGAPPKTSQTRERAARSPLLSTFNHACCGNCLEDEVQINYLKTLTGLRQGFDWNRARGTISTSEGGKDRRRRQKSSDAHTVLVTTSAKPVSPMKTENRHVVGSPLSELTQIAKGKGRKTFLVYITLCKASP